MDETVFALFLLFCFLWVFGKYDIELPARIIAVCDAYKSIRSGRPFQKVLTKISSVDELVECSSVRFDPRVVQVF